jgi:hypothetical protein
LAVNRLHGKEGPYAYTKVIYEVVPFINHSELGLAVRYLGSWYYVLWNKNKLLLSKVSSFVRLNGSADLGNDEHLPHEGEEVPRGKYISNSFP